MTERGGKRKGAGRPKGTPNKKQAKVVANVEASGILPLDYMLSVMRDEAGEKSARMDAAKAAAPYVHAKLTHNKNENETVGIEDIAQTYDAALADLRHDKERAAELLREQDKV